jgi:hypothetical protein
MKKFTGDVKRRHIYRIAAAYAAPARVLFQLSDNLVLLTKLPEWDGADSKAHHSDALSVAFQT